MKSYANSLNAEAVLSKVDSVWPCNVASFFLGSCMLFGLGDDVPLSLVFWLLTLQDHHRSGFLSTLGFIPRYLFWWGMNLCPYIVPEAFYLVRHQTSQMPVCHFLLFLRKKFNYLKTKLLLWSEHTCNTQSICLLECHKLQEGIIHCIVKRTFYSAAQSTRLSMVF